MAVLAIFHGRGLTTAMYDQLRPVAAWETNHPKGGLFHACAVDPNGDVRVADVWESEADLNDFFANRLAPAFQKLGFPLPEAAVYPLHAAHAYPAVLDLNG